jgi:alcohol dehydrogenase, propanol-preferring
MQMMRAAVLDGYGDPLRQARVAIPIPGPDEILIKLESSGICHSDVHIWRGETVASLLPDPYILGHEGVGTVAAVGADVATWQTGDRAGVGWIHETCGICDPCKTGQESFCQSQRAHGFDVPGTFAEYVVAKADFAVRLPTGKASGLAPLLCAGLTAQGALDRAKLRHGETCAIFGCGGLGLYAVQLAARRGAHVIAVDTDPAKLALATQFGAHDTLQAGNQQQADLSLTNTSHVTINFAPTPQSWAAMVALTRPLGRIVAAALVSEPVPLMQDWLTWSGITVSGTSVGTRGQMADLMAIHANQPLESEIVEIALDDVSEALLALAEGRARGRFCIVY